jgi:eukaryotic-like serine/threonine-protein kinase
VATDLLRPKSVEHATPLSTVIQGPAQIGRYEILGLLGEGGMGRVYRARDPQLARVVAVKVLPQAFAADEDRLRRFEQEARATAALNHPGIMGVFDVGVHEGAPYLVSELLEGTTLRARMDAGRLPIEKTLDFAIQIADALTAAHARGIVHRDLKPDNLFVCAGDRIKILDFGLAKLTATDSGPGQVDVTGTQLHTVIGTPGYMAPEQARGEIADHRADIFSFGCVLYEMLEGHRAFEGRTPVDLITAVIKDSPQGPASSIERPLPPVLDSIVLRCLAKEPSARFQSASDLAFALQSSSRREVRAESATAAAAGGVRQGRWRQIVPGLVIGTALAAVGMIAFGATYFRSTAVRPAVTEFLVPPPAEGLSFAVMPLPGLLPTAPQVGLSPDGRQLAFITSDPEGKRALWIRSLDVSRPRFIEGTDGASSYPFWSPDSRDVVIAVKRALMKVNARTGTIERLCTLPDAAPPEPFVTGSWGDDGSILFSIGGPTGLYRTDVSGKPPQVATTLDKARGDHYHSWPQLLPGKRFLFFVRTDKLETNGVYAGRLDSADSRMVQGSAARGSYADGHLIWSIEDRVVAQPFDISESQLTGRPATLVPSVFQGAGRTSAFWASSTDTLAYAAGATRERQFRWFTRTGDALDGVGPPGLYATFDVAPDLSKVVVEVSKDPTARYSTLALFDTARGLLAPLTLGDQNDSDPRFGANGDVVFARNSREGAGIVRINPTTSQQAMVLPRGTLPVLWLEDAAGDGAVVYRSGANRDAWQQLPGGAEPRRLTNAREPIEQVQVSPDRQWFVYNTAESGRSEVYLASVASGQRLQVSVSGGVQATWRADGRELYFLSLDADLYSVEIQPGQDMPRAGAPKLLFKTSLPVISAVVEQYRPSDDGQKFLFCLPLTSVRREPLRMLMNWRAALDAAREAP